MTVKTGFKVRELMQTDVITIEASASLEEAVRTLEENRISGAPVVEGDGELVGVLSLHDLASSEHVSEGRLDDERREYYLTNPLGEAMGEESPDDDEFFSKEDYSPEVLGRDTVRDWMSADILSVSPGASLREACELMAGESVHRVLVVEKGKLHGIVTSMDVVRFLAREL